MMDKVKVEGENEAGAIKIDKNWGELVGGSEGEKPTY